MYTIPLKTRVMCPPKDDLYAVLDEYLQELQERDVLVVTSKIVAIHQGRCVPITADTDKQALIEQESDAYLPAAEPGFWNLSVKVGALLLSAGIDESNADNHFILLPEHPSKMAQEIHTYLQKRFEVRDIAVVITDSHSIPFRYGTLGVAIGWHGFRPVMHFTGSKDLFGRTFHYTRINVADALAAIGVFAMGETTEQTPLCIIREAPYLEFVDAVTTNELFIPPKEDIYYSLLKPFYEKENPQD